MDGGMPQPRGVEDSAQFVAVMRQLRQWADVSYRELERRAGAVGDVLPRATLSGALSRRELPREELLAAFVRACGGDEATVGVWVGVRRRLAVELEQRSFAPEASAGVRVPEVAEPSPPGDERLPLAEPVPDADTDSADAAQDADTDADTDADAATDAHADTGTHADADAAPVSATVGLALVTADPAPPRSRRAVRALRRPAVVVTAAVAMVLLGATLTGVLGARDTPSGEPHDQRSGTPATTISPSSKPPAPSADAKPAKNTPAPAGTPRKTSPSARPPKKTTTPREPTPGRSSWTPAPGPYDPSPYEPPPSTDTPPPTGGGDPFPTETCWDATNECT